VLDATALRIDDCGANAALDDECPFGCRGVPVKLAHRARFEPHGDPGDAFGDWQLLDRRLLAVTSADDLSLRFLQGKLEGRQVIAREERIGDVVHEARIAGRRRLRCGHSCRSKRGADKNVASLHFGHDDNLHDAVDRDAPKPRTRAGHSLRQVTLLAQPMSQLGQKRRR
jgi:hypothetical protein